MLRRLSNPLAGPYNISMHAVMALAESLRPHVPCTSARDSLFGFQGISAQFRPEGPPWLEQGPVTKPEQVPNWLNSLLFSLHQGKLSRSQQFGGLATLPTERAGFMSALLYNLRDCASPQDERNRAGLEPSAFGL